MFATAGEAMGHVRHSGGCSLRVPSPDPARQAWAGSYLAGEIRRPTLTLRSAQRGAGLSHCATCRMADSDGPLNDAYGAEEGGRDSDHPSTAEPPRCVYDRHVQLTDAQVAIGSLASRVAGAVATWAQAAYTPVGWRVFPVVTGGKKPLYRGWQRDATTDPEMIARYWRREPSPNIGVVAGETFDAWDIEVAHVAALRGYLRRGGHELPLTPVARTGRGGIHILTEPTGVGGSRDLYLDGTHVGELKSSGGFIVVCPSVTQGPYTWLRMPEAMAVAPAPPWLLALLERPRRAIPPPRRRGSSKAPAQALDALAVAVRDAGEGRRNNFLYWAMRRALEEGIPAPIATKVLLRAALVAGLEESETQATIRSALESAADA